MWLQCGDGAGLMWREEAEEEDDLNAFGERVGFFTDCESFKRFQEGVT